MGWLSTLRTLPVWRQVVYWLAVIGAFGLLIWDIADKGAQYTTVGVLVLVGIATIALRAPDREAAGP